MASRMNPEKKGRTLAEIIEAEFTPMSFTLTAEVNQKLVKRGFPNAVWLVPKAFAADVFEALELEDYCPPILPVGAFRPTPGMVYGCYLRLRPGGRTIDAIPADVVSEQGRNLLLLSGAWAPKPKLTDFEIVLEQDARGHWTGLNPKTGAYIQSYGMTFAPSEDGKVHLPAGKAAIRGAATRTFDIMGNPKTIERLTDAAIHGIVSYVEDEYEVEKRMQRTLSAACEFPIMRVRHTAFEIIGNPFNKVVEIENFASSVVAPMVTQFERWMRDVFEPLLHPDKLDHLDVPDITRPEIATLAAQTRNELNDMIEWVEFWAESFERMYKRSRVAGVKMPLAVPPLAEKRPARKWVLINFDRNQLFEEVAKTAKSIARKLQREGGSSNLEKVPGKRKNAPAMTTEIGDQPGIKEILETAKSRTKTNKTKKKDLQEDKLRGPRVVKNRKEAVALREEQGLGTTDDTDINDPTAADTVPVTTNGHSEFGLNPQAIAVLTSAKGETEDDTPVEITVKDLRKAARNGINTELSLRDLELKKGLRFKSQRQDISAMEHMLRQIAEGEITRKLVDQAVADGITQPIYTGVVTKVKGGTKVKCPECGQLVTVNDGYRGEISHADHKGANLTTEARQRIKLAMGAPKMVDTAGSADPSGNGRTDKKPVPVS